MGIDARVTGEGRRCEGDPRNRWFGDGDSVCVRRGEGKIWKEKEDAPSQRCRRKEVGREIQDEDEPGASERKVKERSTRERGDERECGRAGGRRKRECSRKSIEEEEASP